MGRNILAIVVGIIVGAMVNMGLVMAGHAIIPPPAGVDVMDIESLKAAMPAFGAKHFVFPFLAHALGTFAGAALAARITKSHPMPVALVIGAFFLLGGIYNAVTLPAPVAFIVMDLALAYLPMAWLGGRLSGNRN